MFFFDRQQFKKVILAHSREWERGWPEDYKSTGNKRGYTGLILQSANRGAPGFEFRGHMMLQPNTYNICLVTSQDPDGTEESDDGFQEDECSSIRSTNVNVTDTEMLYTSTEWSQKGQHTQNTHATIPICQFKIPHLISCSCTK